MRRSGILTYLAQGAGANAITVALFLLGVAVYKPQAEVTALLMVAAPFCLTLFAIAGAIVGCWLWLAECLCGARLGFFVRALVGLVLTMVITLLLDLASDTPPESSWLPALISFLGIVLPATLMCGSRFNPLRSVVFGLGPSPFPRDFGNCFSVFPGTLLRVGSLLGLFEAMMYLARLPAEAIGDWRPGASGFLETLAAVSYFGATALVSFGLPRKKFVAVAAVAANAPLLWTMNMAPTNQSEFFAVVGGIFVGLWSLFTLGRLLAVEDQSIRQRNRILPVTFFEIKVRHALNQW